MVLVNPFTKVPLPILKPLTPDSRFQEVSFPPACHNKSAEFGVIFPAFRKIGLKQGLLLWHVELEVWVKKSKSSKSDAEITLIKVSPIGSMIVNEISLSQFPECHINSIAAPVVEYTESNVKLWEQSKLPTKPPFIFTSK